MKHLIYNKEFVKKSSFRIRYNKELSEYYKRKALEDNNEVLNNHAKSLIYCLKYWDVDYFRLQAVKDVLRVNACKDLFCQNCQHNLSLKRFAKYSPVLEDMSENYDIYHIVFTVPNCLEEDLKATVKLMYKKFRYITEYFKASSKSRFFDFSQFGYAGAVRALEVTFKKNNGQLEYHPHFHCLFLLKKSLDFKKVEYNRFSFSNKTKEVKSFSKFEIFLQKFWRLIFDGKQFNEKNFNELDRGYSVTADKCKEGKYHEVFKYALGGLFKKGFDLSYNIFSTLFDSLYRRKIIQGYGILNRFSFDCDDEDIVNEYFETRKRLETFESPTFLAETLENVVADMETKDITYISKFRKNYEDVK